MRMWASRCITIGLLCASTGVAWADDVENHESCERVAIREGVRRATGLLSPAEMYNAEVRVDSVEPSGVTVFEDHSIISYLVTIRLNQESTVVYSVKTEFQHESVICDLQRSTTYRRRTEI